ARFREPGLVLGRHDPLAQKIAERLAGARVEARGPERRTRGRDRQLIETRLHLAESVVDALDLFFGEHVGRLALDLGEALVVGFLEGLEALEELVHRLRHVTRGGLAFLGTGERLALSGLRSLVLGSTHGNSFLTQTNANHS